jgi:hypothetical protein
LYRKRVSHLLLHTFHRHLQNTCKLLIYMAKIPFLKDSHKVTKFWLLNMCIFHYRQINRSITHFEFYQVYITESDKLLNELIVLILKSVLYSETSIYRSQIIRFPGSVIQFLWSLSESYLNYGSCIYCFPGSIVSFSDPPMKTMNRGFTVHKTADAVSQPRKQT